MCQSSRSHAPKQCLEVAGSGCETLELLIASSYVNPWDLRQSDRVCATLLDGVVADEREARKLSSFVGGKARRRLARSDNLPGRSQTTAGMRVMGVR